MKKTIPAICIALCLLFSVSCAKMQGNIELTVYSYDSFDLDLSAFEKQNNIKVNVINCGSGIELYSRLVYEGSSCKADVVIGIPDMIKTDPSLFYSFESEHSKSLIDYDRMQNLIPFNYGVLAFNLNNDNSLAKIPENLEDLTEDIYKDSFILIDPRTSSVGLGLLLWTIETMGENEALYWWNKACENALTTSPSWSMAYGLFSSCEAPLVISYTTSPVYHKLNKEDFDTQALVFDKGHHLCAEYLGILKTSDKKEVSEKLCNYILKEGQKDIAIYNTMLPANKDTVLPAEFDIVPETEICNKNISADKINSYLDKWTEVVLGE